MRTRFLLLVCISIWANVLAAAVPRFYRDLATKNEPGNKEYIWESSNNLTLISKGVEINTTWPWINTSNPILNEIRQSDPCRGNDGWEIFQFNFEVQEYENSVPYFILYNKYQGVMRFFIYYDSPLSSNQVLYCRLKKSSYANVNLFSKSTTGTVSLDEFLPHEDCYSIFKPTHGTKWGVFEVEISYDEFLSAYEHKSTHFDLSFGKANASNILYDNTSLLTGNEILTTYSTDKSTSANIALSNHYNTLKTNKGRIDNMVVDETQKIQDFLLNPPVLILGSTEPLKTSYVYLENEQIINWGGQNDIIDNSESLLFNKTKEKKLIYTLGKANYCHEQNNMATRGFIAGQISGTISLYSPVMTLSMRLPGNNNFTINNKVYEGPIDYIDCPMGIFSLNNTPRIHWVKQNTQTGSYSYHEECSGKLCNRANDVNITENYYQEYASGKLNHKFDLVFNKASGLTLKEGSEKYSLVMEVPTRYFDQLRYMVYYNELDYHRYEEYESGNTIIEESKQIINPLRNEIDRQHYYWTGMNGTSSIISTPFLSRDEIHQFKVNLPNNGSIGQNKIKLRVRATFYDPKGKEYTFTKDFFVDESVSTGNSINPFTQLPYYSNYQYPPYTTESVGESYVAYFDKALRDDYTTANMGIISTSYTARNNNKVDMYGANVVITSITNFKNTHLKAERGSYIKFSPSSFYGNYKLSGTGNIVGLQEVNYDCNQVYKGLDYNIANKQLTNTAIEDGHLTLYPNPATQWVDGALQLDDNEMTPMDVIIKDLMGTPYKSFIIKQKSFGLDISDIPAGSYVVQVKGQNLSFSKKLIVY